MRFIRTLAPLAVSALALTSGLAQSEAPRIDDHLFITTKKPITVLTLPFVGPTTSDPSLNTSLRRWHVLRLDPLSPQGYANEKLAADLGLDRVYVARFVAHADLERMSRALSASRIVERVERDQIVEALGAPNDPLIALCWGLNNTGQSGGTVDADIDAFEAWDVFTGSDNVIAAILDTGVDGNHQEFVGRMLAGWNTYSNNGNTSDGNGHGTHTCGTTTAKGNNSLGVAGVSHSAAILPVKVLSDAGGGTWESVANGFTWAVDHGARVLNVSLGGGQPPAFVEAAVNYAWGQGAVICAAAGNGGGNNMIWPARYVNCIAVGATDHTDARAGFSSYGADLDVTAPGANVYSTVPGNQYGFNSGTSMATPHVSGLAALLFSLDPALSNSQVRSLIESTCDDKGSAGWDQFFGFGRINANRAILTANLPLVYPTSISVYRGVGLTGGVNEIRWSDNARATLNPGPATGPTDPPVSVIVRGFTTTLSPTRVDLLAETSTTANGLTLRLELWNYAAGVWEIVHSSQVGTSDTPRFAIITSNPSRFVHQGSGEMTGRVSIYPTAPVASTWSARFDQLRFASR